MRHTVTGQTDTEGRTVHLRTCPPCEAMCGLEIHVAEQKVQLIRGDREDVWSKGYLCLNGAGLGHLHHDPDRLRVPTVRTATSGAKPRGREHLGAATSCCSP